MKKLFKKQINDKQFRNALIEVPFIVKPLGFFFCRNKYYLLFIIDDSLPKQRIIFDSCCIGMDNEEDIAPFDEWTPIGFLQDRICPFIYGYYKVVESSLDELASIDKPPFPLNQI